MRISVFSSPELEATILAIQGFEREVRKQVRQRLKAMAQPEFQKAVTERADTKLEQLVLANTARVSVSDQNVMLQAARIGRPLSGGLNPKTDWAAVEFGADTKAERTYDAVSSRGKHYKVTRRTSAQLRPRRRQGYAVFPAIAEMIPRIASLWIQTTIRTLHETLERK